MILIGFLFLLNIHLSIRKYKKKAIINYKLKIKKIKKAASYRRNEFELIDFISCK
jgi:hypothetical protein